jgi:hypothetical protein
MSPASPVSRRLHRQLRLRPAGGIVLRDLFEQDEGGWLEDVTLLGGLVAAKLKAEAERIAAEGWKWVEVATEFPYGSKPKGGGGGQTRKRAERFFVNGFRG